MHLSGAKAHVDFAAFTARLKSCPVTKPLYIRSEFALAKIEDCAPCMTAEEAVIHGAQLLSYSFSRLMLIL
jgi:hypothetical protein